MTLVGASVVIVIVNDTIGVDDTVVAAVDFTVVVDGAVVDCTGVIVVVVEGIIAYGTIVVGDTSVVDRAVIVDMLGPLGAQDNVVDIKTQTCSTLYFHISCKTRQMTS